jgi:hypothetical protein
MRNYPPFIWPRLRASTPPLRERLGCSVGEILEGIQITMPYTIGALFKLSPNVVAVTEKLCASARTRMQCKHGSCKSLTWSFASFCSCIHGERLPKDRKRWTGRRTDSRAPDRHAGGLLHENRCLPIATCFCFTPAHATIRTEHLETCMCTLFAGIALLRRPVHDIIWLGGVFG